AEHRGRVLHVAGVQTRARPVLAAVAAARVERGGHCSLAAFFVPSPGAEPGAVVSAVRDRLARTAPPHLVPSLIMPVDALERTHTARKSVAQGTCGGRGVSAAAR